MAEQQEPGQDSKMKIDQRWLDLFKRMATDQEFGLQMSLRIQRDLEVNLEHHLADLVCDYIISNTALEREQRAQIRLEVQPTMFNTFYIIHYALPGEPTDEPRTVLCFWKNDHWEIMPLPESR